MTTWVVRGVIWAIALGVLAWMWRRRKGKINVVKWLGLSALAYIISALGRAALGGFSVWENLMSNGLGASLMFATLFYGLDDAT